MGSPNHITLDSLLNSFHNFNLNLNYASASASANLWFLIGGNGYPTKSQIFSAALTPLGSQTIQQILSLNIPEDINAIFEAVIHSIFDLMINKFGHYVFGNLIPLLNNQQLYQIAATLAMYPRDLVLVCIDRFGSPSIKRFIKQISRFDAAASVLIEALCMGFKNLMIDKTGRHVILQCVESFNYLHTQLLYKEAMKIENIHFLGTNVTGCLALSSFIAASKGQGRNLLLESISEFSIFLAQDPYGNFVVQCLLDLQHPEFTIKICRKLKGLYLKMSLLKESSHVVEKCLRSIGRIHVVQEFVMCPDKVLLQVAKDQFGNFVIQTAIKETREDSRCLALHCRLVGKIRMQVRHLNKGPGKNVATLIDMLVNSDQKDMYSARSY